MIGLAPFDLEKRGSTGACRVGQTGQSLAHDLSSHRDAQVGQSKLMAEVSLRELKMDIFLAGQMRASKIEHVGGWTVETTP